MTVIETEDAETGGYVNIECENAIPTTFLIDLGKNVNDFGGQYLGHGQWVGSALHDMDWYEFPSETNTKKFVMMLDSETHMAHPDKYYRITWRFTDSEDSVIEHFPGRDETP